MTPKGQEARPDDFRRDFAARVLLVMLESGGDKADKVRAAVEYADRLIAELARPASCKSP